MSVIIVLIGFGILLAGSFLLAFLWAVKTGQFDDRHTPAIRMLFEDEKKIRSPQIQIKKNSLKH